MIVLSIIRRSRLGCQVKLAKNMNGMIVKLPSATRNVRPSALEYCKPDLIAQMAVDGNFGQARLNCVLT